MSSNEFHRSGPLKDLTSYPLWLQRVVRETCADKARVVNHPVFAMMRDATLPAAMLRRFLTGVWLTIERFPQFMAMNLQKIQFGDSPGAQMARRYLIQNIRVEQKHADHWLAWAETSGLSLADLRDAKNCSEQQALAHWCWYISAQPSLAVGVAATNYAVEGATGEWSCVVCSKDAYEKSFPESRRVSAMRWLRVHAEYDDTHPWEALDIVATLMGNSPPPTEIDAIRTAVRASYSYMALALNGVLTAETAGVGRESDSKPELIRTQADSAKHARRRTAAERVVATV
ncbi:MAG: TenA family transcriptional regulator [Burkholderiaceae bacterium]|nr:TenA family transcriptional regulator [Burkholderiaceae bacterium]